MGENICSYASLGVSLQQSQMFHWSVPVLHTRKYFRDCGVLWNTSNIIGWVHPLILNIKNAWNSSSEVHSTMFDGYYNVCIPDKRIRAQHSSELLQLLCSHTSGISLSYYNEKAAGLDSEMKTRDHCEIQKSSNRKSGQISCSTSCPRNQKGRWVLLGFKVKLAAVKRKQQWVPLGLTTHTSSIMAGLRPKNECCHLSTLTQLKWIPYLLLSKAKWKKNEHFVSSLNC